MGCHPLSAFRWTICTLCKNVCERDRDSLTGQKRLFLSWCFKFGRFSKLSNWCLMGFFKKKVYYLHFPFNSVISEVSNNIAITYRKTDQAPDGQNPIMLFLNNSIDFNWQLMRGTLTWPGLLCQWISMKSLQPLEEEKKVEWHRYKYLLHTHLLIQKNWFFLRWR